VLALRQRCGNRLCCNFAHLEPGHPGRRTRRYDRAEVVRLLARELRRVGDCWELIGIGQLHLGGRLIKVHRLVYELAGGDTSGFKLARTCGNERCSRPDHLAPARDSRSAAVARTQTPQVALFGVDRPA
jgi:hypothetical protein